MHLMTPSCSICNYFSIITLIKKVVFAEIRNSWIIFQTKMKQWLLRNTWGSHRQTSSSNIFQIVYRFFINISVVIEPESCNGVVSGNVTANQLNLFILQSPVYQESRIFYCVLKTISPTSMLQKGNTNAENLCLFSPWWNLSLCVFLF